MVRLVEVMVKQMSWHPVGSSVSGWMHLLASLASNREIFTDVRVYLMRCHRGRYPAHLDCREQRAVKRLFLLFVGQALAVKACLYTYTLICC